jgi:hypothetical protein
MKTKSAIYKLNINDEYLNYWLKADYTLIIRRNKIKKIKDRINELYNR